MLKITPANRKFLEKQVRLALLEQEYHDINTTYKIGKSLQPKDFDASKSLVEFGKGIINGFIDIGNMLISHLLYNNNNFDRALKTMVLKDEAGGAQNQRDLQNIKDFLSIFDTLAPTKGRWSGNNLMNPKHYTESKVFKYYLKRAERFAKSKKDFGTRVTGKQYYLNLYDSMSRRGKSPIRMRGLFIEKQILEEQGFFEKLSEIQAPVVNASLLFLRPFYYETKKFDPSFSTQAGENAEAPEELIQDYKDLFTQFYEKQDYNSNYVNLYDAFRIASIVDPSGQHTLSEWFWAIKKKKDKGSGPEGMAAGIGAFVPWLAYALGQYSFIEKGVGKIVNSANPHKFTSLPAILVMVYDFLSVTALVNRGSIEDIIKETVKMIEQIESSKDSNGSWVFTDAENKKWKTKFLELNHLLQKYHQSFMRDNAWSSIDSKLAKYQNSVVPAFKYLSEQSMSNINSTNVAEIKNQLNNSISTIEQYYDETSGTQFSGPAKDFYAPRDSKNESMITDKQLLTEDRSGLKKVLKRLILKHTKDNKNYDWGPGFGKSQKKRLRRVKEIHRIIDRYEIDDIEAAVAKVRTLQGLLKEVKDIASMSKASEMALIGTAAGGEETVSSGTLTINFNKFLLRNAAELGLEEKDLKKAKNKGFKDQRWIRGGLIKDLQTNRTEAVQVLYFDFGKAKIRGDEPADSIGFHYGQAGGNNGQVNWLFNAFNKPGSGTVYQMSLKDLLPETFKLAKKAASYSRTYTELGPQKDGKPEGPGTYTVTNPTSLTWLEKYGNIISKKPVKKMSAQARTLQYYLRVILLIQYYHWAVLAQAINFFERDDELTKKLNAENALAKINIFKNLTLMDAAIAESGFKIEDNTK